MASRLNLHSEFCTILGTTYAYFQPPESFKLRFPCIVYDFTRGDQKHADNRTYLFTRGYNVKYITEDPDNAVVDTIVAKFPMCSFDQHYTSENLHYYVFTIFW